MNCDQAKLSSLKLLLLLNFLYDDFSDVKVRGETSMVGGAVLKRLRLGDPFFFGWLRGRAFIYRVRCDTHPPLIEQNEIKSERAVAQENSKISPRD